MLCLLLSSSTAYYVSLRPGNISLGEKTRLLCIGSIRRVNLDSNYLRALCAIDLRHALGLADSGDHRVLGLVFGVLRPVANTGSSSIMRTLCCRP